MDNEETVQTCIVCGNNSFYIVMDEFEGVAPTHQRELCTECGAVSGTYIEKHEVD